MNGTSKYINLITGPGSGVLPAGNEFDDILAWNGLEWGPKQLEEVSSGGLKLQAKKGIITQANGYEVTIIWDKPFLTPDYFHNDLWGRDSNNNPVTCYPKEIREDRIIVASPNEEECEITVFAVGHL